MHLLTPRLLIRSLAPADIEPLVALWTEEVVTRHLGGPRDAGKVREALQAALAAPSQPFDLWPVVSRSQPEGPPLGECGLLAKEIDGVAEIELVYIFAQHGWGQGYATEAATALRDYALRQLSLPRLVALIEPGHTASARVAEKLGFQRARQTTRPSGRVMDLYVREK